MERYGNLYEVTDPYNTTIRYEYDDAYHTYVKKETNLQTGVFTEYGTYNAMGMPSSSNAPRKTTDTALTTSYSYDSLNRLYQTTNPDATYSLIHFDANGNKTSVRDEKGNISTFTYDAFGNVNSETSTADVGNVEQLVTVEKCHDELGLLKWVKWKRGGLWKTISYDYSERNQLTQESFPGTLPGWYKYKYNGNGQMSERSEGSGSTTHRTLTFSYDDAGRPYEDKHGTTLLARRYYYDDGLIQKVQDGTGAYVEYTYDGAHRQKTEYQSLVNKTVHTVYSTAPTNNQTVYIRNGIGELGAIQGRYFHEYDSGGRPNYLTSPQGPVGIGDGPKTYFEYGSYGLLSQMTYDTRSTRNTYAYTTYSYDNSIKKRLWLKSLGNYRGDGSIISSFTYDCDAVGNREKITEANGDYTNYTYDKSYQLRTEQRFTSGASSIYSYDYRYDEAGNRNYKSIVNSLGTSTFSSVYADNNLLDYIIKSSTTVCDISYDNFGNQSRRVAGGDTWDYTYDSLNRLTSVKEGTYAISSFKYDPLGRRVEKKTQNDTVIRRYVYGGSGVIAETDASNNIIAWYTPGICETRNPDGSGWDTLYYHVDGLGSTRQLTDDMQRVADAYSYSAWGEEMGSLRPVSGTDTGKPVNPYRFVGKSGYYCDDETGLQLLGARYYDPLIGRFITQDPIRDGMNWYAYAGNNPVMMVDPVGLEPVAISRLQRSKIESVISFMSIIGQARLSNAEILDMGLTQIGYQHTWQSKSVGLQAILGQSGNWGLKYDNTLTDAAATTDWS